MRLGQTRLIRLQLIKLGLLPEHRDTPRSQTSTYSGRYPGWQVLPARLPMHVCTVAYRDRLLLSMLIKDSSTCLPLRGQHALA